MKNLRRGFTLIELLVTISIIGILSAFLLANFVGIRQRARDGVRKSDLRQIQQALELYRSDKGMYPNSLYPNVSPQCGSSFQDASATPVVYMQKLPCDPSTGAFYAYTVSQGNTTYTIVGCLENTNDSQKDSSLNPPCNSPSVSYTLSSP